MQMMVFLSLRPILYSIMLRILQFAINHDEWILECVSIEMPACKTNEYYSAGPSAAS